MLQLLLPVAHLHRNRLRVSLAEVALTSTECQCRRRTPEIAPAGVIFRWIIARQSRSVSAQLTLLPWLTLPTVDMAAASYESDEDAMMHRSHLSQLWAACRHHEANPKGQARRLRICCWLCADNCKHT
jgi:hypothetical protein